VSVCPVCKWGECLCLKTRTPDMLLRDYFAAHAPRKPWPDYKPTMSTPKPEPDWGDIEPDWRADVDPLNWAQRAEWDSEFRQQYHRQWPYFYADAMLKERAK
jgi:hypothetical protein